MPAAKKSPYSAKPSTLPNPVPAGKFEGPEFEALAAELDAMNSAAAEAEAPQAASGSTYAERLAQRELEQQYAEEGGIGESILGALPAIGGFVGGAIGGVGGAVGGLGVGAIPGAALGGASGAVIGQSAKELIETFILGRDYGKDAETVASGLGKAVIEEGASQLVGGAVGKVVGKGIKLIPKATLEPAKQYLDDALKAIKDAVEEPVARMIAQKSTPMSPEVAGDVAKKLLQRNIQTKYGTFTKAYGEIAEVAGVTPLRDESRRAFTNRLKEWAADELSGDNYKVVKKFADGIDAANTGKQFDDVIRQISDAKKVAFRSGASNQYTLLKQLQGKAEDFAETELIKLSGRISAGKATQAEMQALIKIAGQQGLPESEALKYSKSIAMDYLKKRGKVKKEYAAFKEFIEEVGEQTKTKVGKKGPLTFLNSLDEVSSEKLIERMFDPKNARALRTMKANTPEVFDVVAKAKVSELIRAASPNKKLDLALLHEKIHELPPDTLHILFSPAELRQFAKVIENPKLKRLATVNAAGEKGLLKWMKEISDIGLTTGEVAVKSRAVQSGLRQATGKGLLNMVKPEEEPR